MSAAMKLLVTESESDALVAGLSRSDVRLAASRLLHTEPHCAAGRNPSIITLAAVTVVLDAQTFFRSRLIRYQIPPARKVESPAIPARTRDRRACRLYRAPPDSA
jgi:hypothetical protein